MSRSARCSSIAFACEVHFFMLQRILSTDMCQLGKERLEFADLLFIFIMMPHAELPWTRTGGDVETCCFAMVVPPAYRKQRGNTKVSGTTDSNLHKL